jgi:hypothetical protein
MCQNRWFAATSLPWVRDEAHPPTAETCAGSRGSMMHTFPAMTRGNLCWQDALVLFHHAEREMGGSR